MQGSLTPVKELKKVTGGSLTGNLYTTIRWAGSLNLTGCEVKPAEWIKYWIKISHIFYNPQTGEEVRTPLGVFTPVSVKIQDENAEGGVSQEVSFCDLTAVPYDSQTASTYTVSAETPVVEAIERILARSGKTIHSLDANLGRLRSALTWEAKTSRLKIINDILAAAGFFALYATPTGVLTSSKYLRPQAREIEYNFTHLGEKTVHLPGKNYSFDLVRPNEIVCISTSTGEKKALTATARNENPDSPFSYQNLGRWITEIFTEVEAVSQDALEAYALRKLDLNMAGKVFERQMLYTPLALNSIVRGKTGLETVENIRINFTPGELMTVTSREVGA